MNNLYENVKIVNIKTMIKYYEKLYVDEINNQIEWIEKNQCICDDINDDIHFIGTKLMDLYQYENINGFIFGIDNFQHGLYEMWVINLDDNKIIYLGDDNEIIPINDNLFKCFDVGYFGKYVQNITNDKLIDFVNTGKK